MNSMFQANTNFNLRYVLFLITGLVAATIFLTANKAEAQLFSGSKDEACIAVGANSGDKCDQDKLNQSGTTLSTTLKNIINIVSIIVGIAAVIMLVISGLRYVTSAGDSNQITSAKHTLIYALVGLVVVALAQAIVKFVLNRVS